MLIIPPPKVRNRPRVKRAPAAPVLVSAIYDPVGLTITLAFDRNVRLVGIDGTQISVNDPVTNATLYQATGSVGRLSITTLEIGLEAVGSASGSQILLNATSGNGVRTPIGNGVWTGVLNVALPFWGVSAE